MTVLYWIAGAVLLVLFALAFRRKRVADRICHFTRRSEAANYVFRAEADGFDCFISADSDGIIEVRCYRRKEHKP
jgi:hypothetical protein